MVKLTLAEAYTILGLPSTYATSTTPPSEDEIKKAYRKMAVKTHPDKNQDDPVSLLSLLFFLLLLCFSLLRNILYESSDLA